MRIIAFLVTYSKSVHSYNLICILVATKLFAYVLIRLPIFLSDLHTYSLMYCLVYDIRAGGAAWRDGVARGGEAGWRGGVAHTKKSKINTKLSESVMSVPEPLVRVL